MCPQGDPRIAVLLKYPTLNLIGEISIVNGNYLMIATTDLEMSVPYTGLEFQE